MGRCSLTVALPVLSCMGCQCSVLPTGLLSAHTGFPEPYRRSLTEDIPQIAAHWKKQNIRFDAISTGYLADPRQAQAVIRVLEAFPAAVIVDPAMADHGRLYSGIGQAHVQAMKDLCRMGRYLLPNVTEAALLTGMPYREKPDRKYLAALLEGLLAFGAEAAVITGVTGSNGKIGFAEKSRGQEPYFYEAPCIARSFHGTGDLFTAVFTGALMQGKTPRQAAVQAAHFVEHCIAATPEQTPMGVCFESQLFRLTENMD